MPETTWQQTVASIRDMVLARDTAGIDDASLLKLFVSESEGAAFEAIVRRHGPLVYGVCLRVLQNASDAEDAFQATFLVLVRKAAGLKRPELLGNWLHGVAFQTARSVRTTARRHRKLEGLLTPRTPQSIPADFYELAVVLDEELERLPAKFRIPIILCELQEKSRKDVATILDVPEGTISSRLARGKAMLAQQLTRRNITLASATIGTTLASTSVAPSAALVQLTVRAGAAAVAGKSAVVGIASARVLQLSETVLKIMFVSKLKLCGALIAGSVFLLTGAGLLTAQARRGPAAITSSASAADDEKKLTAPPAAQISRFRAAFDAAAEIDDLQTRLTFFLLLAYTQLNAGDRRGALATLTEALPLVRGMEESTKKVMFLGNIAQLLVTAGERTQASLIAREVEKMALASRNTQSLNTGLMMAINVWTSLDEFEQSHELIVRNPKQSVILLRTMTRAIHPKKGKEQAAHEALKKLLKLVSDWPNEGQSDITGNQNIMNNLAFKLQTLDFIAILLAEAGFVDEALQVYQANAAQRVARKIGSRVSPLPKMAEALTQASKFSDALKVASYLPKDSTQRLEIVYEIALKQVRVGDFASALQTITDASNIPNNVDVQREYIAASTPVTPHSKLIAKANVLLAIGMAQNAKHNRKEALVILDELRQLNNQITEHRDPEMAELRDIDSDGIPGLSLPKLTPRVTQVQLEAALDEFQAARKTAGNLTSAIEKAQAFFYIGKSLLASGKKSEAKEALSRASRSAERIAVSATGPGRGIFSGRNQELGAKLVKGLLLKQIAGLQAQAGDSEGAFETAESFTSQTRLDALVVDLAEGGDIEGAIDSLDKLASTDSKAQALQGIGRIMSARGEDKAAEALANKQKNPLLRAYALLGIAIGKGPAGESLNQRH